ncbi:hypothetical protein [Pseudomonas koreensis]|uniref:Uncharacterized protein n=1 Tax=Pseudomonas koreensis TaxID=198620 RepID=A0AA94EPB7_9PSED|nr:hypothetical protein [Pseudomonas koreensis]RVD77293.1 hypothetical protein A9HBioS_2807 [Pseudomonas koreensis]
MTVKSGWIGCVALCGWLMAGQALADCVPTPLAGDLDLSVCKEWPAYPGLTISANALFKRGSRSDDAEALSTYDFDLSVLDTAQSKPIATYHRAAAFVLEGVSLREITLDTARYTLTTDLRAFGVRALSTNGSRINPMEENLLSLYVKEGEKLRPVLEKLVVYQYGGEWDGDCEGERYEISRTVEIAKTSSHGYADLIVKTLEKGTTSVGTGDACKTKTTENKPVLTTLRYDGKSYVLPNGFQGL